MGVRRNKPRHLCMFVDDVPGIALWGDLVAEDELEDRLPISETLRAPIKTWVDDYPRSLTGELTGQLTTTWSTINAASR